jgi:hypothetical protein
MKKKSGTDHQFPTSITTDLTPQTKPHPDTNHTNTYKTEQKLNNPTNKTSPRHHPERARKNSFDVFHQARHVH